MVDSRSGRRRQDASRNHVFPRREVPREIGTAVRLERRRRRMSQARLAERAGVGRRTIIRLEAGLHVPNSTLVQALEHILGFGERGLVPGWMDAPEWDRPGRGELARRARKGRGLTLAQVSSRSGLSAATISRFERGLSDCAAIVDPADDGVSAFHNDRYAEALGFADAVAMRTGLKLP